MPVLEETPVSEKRLLNALNQAFIYPAFQPIVHLRDRRIAGFEVLARWEDPLLGTIPPTTFIPVAGRAGLLDRLTFDLVARACAEAIEWPGAFTLAFNVSPEQFRGRRLVDLIEAASKRTSFPMSRLQIEITEGAVCDDLDEARAIIEQLQARGLRVILDDFGVGFSSLTRLQALPFDKIKVDASFVRNMLVSRSDRKIVGAVVGLGQSLGLPVVAEGIETEDQAKMLQSLACDYGQGYFFGRPVPGFDVLEKFPDVAASHDQHSLPLDMSLNQRMALMRGIYNSAPIGLCFVDVHRRIVSMNRHFSSIVCADQMGSIGQDITNVIAAGRAYTRDDLDAALDGANLPPRAFYMKGRERIGLSTIAVARDENGDVTGFSLVIIDISEHRQIIERWGRDRKVA